MLYRKWELFVVSGFLFLRQFFVRCWFRPNVVPSSMSLEWRFDDQASVRLEDAPKFCESTSCICETSRQVLQYFDVDDEISHAHPERNTSHVRLSEVNPTSPMRGDCISRFA